MLNSAQIFSRKSIYFFRCIRFLIFLKLNFVPTITQKIFQIEQIQLSTESKETRKLISFYTDFLINLSHQLSLYRAFQ
jgi:hypothetical protein